MELTIKEAASPDILPKEIEWNYQELKEWAALKAAEYKSIAYTEDQASEMRKDRAALNKVKDLIEDRRKQVKKVYLAPYDKFEAQIKDVLAPIRDAIGTIDVGLKEIDRQYRVDKTNLMHEIYDASVGNLKGIVPFDRTLREENYKKGMTEKKLNQFYADLFKRIGEDVDALDELPERFRSKAMMKYMERFNLSDALHEGKRLEEVEKAMEERRKAAEAQKDQQSVKDAETKQAAAQPDQAEKAAGISQQEETAGVEGTKAPEQAPAQPAEMNTQGQEPQPDNEAIFSLDFRAWGTRAQLMALRQYMIDNGIRFGKVE